MIKRTTKVLEATCDGCGRSLVSRPAPDHVSVNYGLLSGHFGYGSLLDQVFDKVEYHVCEECFEKALGAFRRPAGPVGKAT